MGVRVVIDGVGQVEPEDYRIDEASTPLAGGDSSGGVGTLSLTYAPKRGGSRVETTPWTTQRTNLMQRPLFMGAATSWTATPNATAIFGANAVTLTQVTQTNSGGNWLAPSTTGWFTDFTPGDPFSAGYLVENLGPHAVRLRVATWTGSAYIFDPGVDIAPGETKRVFAENQTTPAGAAYMQPRLQPYGLPIPVGSVLRVSQPIAEKATTLGPYFDGWTSIDGETRLNYTPNPYSIVGGANAVGYSGTSSPAVGVSAAGRSWHQATATAATSAFFTVAGQVIPAVAGDTVCASVRVRNPNASALDFGLTLRGRTSPGGPTAGSETTVLNGPNVTIPAGGEHIFTLSWVVTGATTRGVALVPIRSGVGAAAGGDLIQVTDWHLSRDPGPVFAGSDPDTATERYEWAGAANDSMSAKITQTDTARNAWSGTPNASSSLHETRTHSVVDTPLPALPRVPLEKQVDFIDTNKGSVTGTIRSVSHSRGSGLVKVTANSRLGDFMIETQVQPFVGTLSAAFAYYCSLANIDAGILVDPEIASNPVAFPGWGGNLWSGMKEMATAISADLNLISNNVVLRPVRRVQAVTGRNLDTSFEADGTSLALKQEVIWYRTEEITNSLVYPAGGWSREVNKILSVNAGEVAEYVEETESSLTSVSQPVPMLSVGPEHDSSSVYTVIGDDNIVIPPAQWIDFGGKVEVSIEPDTRKLRVKLTGATGIYQVNGQPMRTFKLALSALTSDSTYSTLRIVGTGVRLNQSSIIIPTGVEPWRTGQEFAPTIDNQFINTLDAAYSAGVRGAARHAGRSLTLSSTVTAINRRGETGQANYPEYAYVQGLWGGGTYGSVKAMHAGKSYSQVSSELYELVKDDFDNQVFGNVAGARVWDRESGRFYRVRTATVQWGQISTNSDSDLIFDDVQERFGAKTYGGKKSDFTGMTYFEANLTGVSA